MSEPEPVDVMAKAAEEISGAFRDRLSDKDKSEVMRAALRALAAMEPTSQMRDVVCRDGAVILECKAYILAAAEEGEATL